jgi:hypothetical protein
MILKSDFHDYYDHMFDLPGFATDRCVFERYTYDGMTRPEMFDFMSKAGLRVPLYGPYCEVAKEVDHGVVAFLDIQKHCGHGKVLNPGLHEPYVTADTFAVEYIPPADLRGNGDGYASWSLRLLVVGYRVFELLYASRRDWRSNVGDGDITLIGELLRYPRPAWAQNYPLCAIDFVIHRDTYEAYALDYNIAPGLRGTGIEERMNAQEIFEELKPFIRKQSAH